MSGGSKVSITFFSASSPYIVGDVASFPAHVAARFIKAGKAHYTNPANQAKEKAITRVRLGETPEMGRPKAIHGNVTSGKDFTAKPDEYDMTHSEDASDLDEDQGEGHPEDPNEPAAAPSQGGVSSSFVSQASKGHSPNVGEQTDADSKVYDAGAKSKAESEALASGTDPAAAGEVAEKAKASPEEAMAGKDDFSDDGGDEDKTATGTTKKKRVKLT